MLQAQSQPARTLVVLINGLNDMLHSFLMYNLFCLIFLFSFVFIVYRDSFEESFLHLALSPVYVWCIGCVSSLGTSPDCSRSDYLWIGGFRLWGLCFMCYRLGLHCPAGQERAEYKTSPPLLLPCPDFNDMWRWLLRLMIGIDI